MAVATGPGEGPLTPEEEELGKTYLASISGKSLTELRALETQLNKLINEEARRSADIADRSLGVKLGATKYAIHKLMYPVVKAPVKESDLAAYTALKTRIQTLSQRMNSANIDSNGIDDFHIINLQAKLLDDISSAADELNNMKKESSSAVPRRVAFQFDLIAQLNDKKIVALEPFNTLLGSIEAFVTSAIAEKRRR